MATDSPGAYSNAVLFLPSAGNLATWSIAEVPSSSVAMRPWPLRQSLNSLIVSIGSASIGDASRDTASEQMTSTVPRGLRNRLAVFPDTNFILMKYTGLNFMGMKYINLECYGYWVRWPVG
jgi:hypothetical protein